jgi:hypothetical protein
LATDCLQVQADIAVCAGDTACIAATNFQEMHPECFGTSSSTAAATQNIRSTAIQQILTISNAISTRMTMVQSRPKVAAVSDLRFGMAAGNPAAQWNFWGSVNADKNKYDRGGFVDAVNDPGFVHNNTFDADVTNVVVGGDYQLNQAVAVGLSAAFDNGNGSAQSYRAGVLQNVVNIDTRGYSVAPYVGWQINQDWSMDASLGYGHVKTDSAEQIVPATLNGSANRLFYGANLSYGKWYGNWQVTGKGSLLHGEEKYGDLTSGASGLMAGTASKNKVDQFRFGGQAGYWVNDSAMPYFGLTYSNDADQSTSAGTTTQSSTEIGKDALLWTVGANFFSIKNSITGGVAYNHETGRTHSRNNSLMANINFRY